jgi:hypothetical protein
MVLILLEPEWSLAEMGFEKVIWAVKFSGHSDTLAAGRPSGPGVAG